MLLSYASCVHVDNIASDVGTPDSNVVHVSAHAHHQYQPLCTISRCQKKNEGCTILFLRLRNYKQGFDLTMSSLFTMTADLDCHKFQSNLGHFQGSLRHLGGY